MSDVVTLPCAVTVTIPRKALNAYAEAVRQRKTGNFVIHLRVGEPMGLTFEVKESFTDGDRKDVIVLT